MSFLRPLCSVVLLFCLQAVSQTVGNHARSLITQPVSDKTRTMLRGNVHPLVSRVADQGDVEDAAPLSRMLMTLRRTEEQETSLKQLLDQQQDRNSPNFHQWLTPEEFGARFGPSDTDIATLTAWLSSHGFSNVSVSKGRMSVEFSGTAGAVRQSFATPLHRFSYMGKLRTANVADPQIPSALSSLVTGFDSLNNFPRRSFSRTYGVYQRDQQTGKVTPMITEAKPNFVYADSGGNNLALTPYDFATIYNVKPLWDSSIDGTGQTIAIVGESDLDPKNFVNFRKLFGLPLGDTSGPTGTQYLRIIHNGPNPGFQSDEVEGNLDTQWAGAVAKGATIAYVSSQGTETTAGIDLSALYIVDNNLASVVSESWGVCEFFAGTGGNTFYKNLWQQAAAQGIAVLVSTGDSGSAVCDQNQDYASYGLSVNAIASTPYTTAVGGTDFQTFFSDGGKFGTTNNSTTKASVTGYIPESTWNSSCTNEQLSDSRSIFPGQSAEQICNNSIAKTRYGLLNTVAASGGRSNCTTSGANVSSCAGGYARPSWQGGTGVPSDAVRSVPDVSLFASNGFSGAFYVICQDNALPAGKTCNVDPPYTNFVGIGGTSASSPAMAGILALVNQKVGARLGNANYNLYSLFNRQVTSGTACSSSSTPNSACPFNDVTAGTIAMPCLKGSRNCTTIGSSSSYGILQGYSASSGYDMATGLGSVNAFNLANNWNSVTYIATTASLSLTPATIQHGANVTANVSVSSTSGTPTGDVTINANTANGSVGAGTLSGGSYSGTYKTFPGGSYTVRAHYGGDSTHAPSDSNAVSLTVTPEDSKTGLTTSFYNFNTNTSVTASSAFYGQYLELVRFNVAAKTCATSTPCNGIPTGNILVRNGSAVYNPAVAVSSEGAAEIQTIDFVPGSYSFSGTYSGDASFNLSTSGVSGFTITKAPTTVQLTSSANSLTATQTATLTVKIPSSSYGNILQTGTVTILRDSTTLGTATVTGTYDSASGLDYATATFTLNGSALSSGANSITAVYSGDGNFAGSTSPAVTISGGVAGVVGSFTLTASPNSISVARGSSATTTISIVSSGGFSGTLTLACVVPGAATGMTCSASPSTIGGSGSAVLTVSAVKGSTISTEVQTKNGSGLFLAGVPLAAIFLLMLPNRKRFSPLIAFLILAGTLAVTGCGSGGNTSTTPPASIPGTPVGTYSVFLTANSGSTAQAMTIAVSVN